MKIIWNVPHKRTKEEVDEKKDIPKKPAKTIFQIWTGLNVQDFEALYNLICGDEVVMRLKQKYRLDSGHPYKDLIKGKQNSWKESPIVALGATEERAHFGNYSLPVQSVCGICSRNFLCPYLPPA